MTNISEGYKDITVQVIDYNRDLARHTWNCYRMTWNNLQNVAYDVNNNKVKECIDNVIKMKALPMPREQAIITFRINNISRVCLAQLTRQRKACFNVESQMPRPIKHNVIIPLNVVKSKYYERAKKLVEDSQNLYDDLIKDGMPPQDARYMTMHGQTTSLVYVVDINTFVSSFGFRCENNLSDEINLVYRLCKDALITRLINDEYNNYIDELTYKMYRDIVDNADADGAKQQVGKNTDKVFGNSFRRYKDANNDVMLATVNCDYNFEKSAWYLELQRIYEEDPSLLFDGEKEMIESWKKH